MGDRQTGRLGDAAVTGMVNRNDLRIQVPGLAFAFSGEEVEAARAAGTLLSLDIELSRLCNLRCIYCYAAPGERRPGELTLSEIIGLIDQAQELGVQTVTLTGGEPLIDERYFTIATYARQCGLAVLLFTNGLRITQETAWDLAGLGVSACVKLDSIQADVQDRMAGVPGTHELIVRGISHLMAVGYGTVLPLSVNAALCRLNLQGMPELWRWSRSRGITPSLSRLQLMGRGAQIPELAVGTEEIRRLYRELADIDRSFGVDWEPSIPWHGGKACVRHFVGCFVDSLGSVQPCSGVPIVAGNIRESPLRTILAEADVFRTARGIEERLEGPCGVCAHNDECYGCRSVAYFSGRGFTGSDPLCWHCAEAEAGHEAATSSTD